jgi:hypothetical protein
MASAESGGHEEHDINGHQHVGRSHNSAAKRVGDVVGRRGVDDTDQS